MHTIYLKYIIILLNTFFVVWLHGQDTLNLQLLDKQSNQAIIGANYQYGEKKGTSDQQGRIFLVLREAKVLQLSHLGYDELALDNKALMDIKQEGGLIYWALDDISLQPVTVVAIRDSRGGSDNITLSHLHKLAHDGGALLDQITGVSGIRKSGGYGYDPVLRGFKYEQINIVQDGIQSATAACPNRMDPASSQMAPNMLEKVEILKGPYALRYGNAIGGTINFKTPSLIYQENKKMLGRFSQSYETNGQIARSELMIGRSGKSYNAKIFGSFSNGNDYQAGNGADVQADFNRLSLGSRFGWKPNQSQEFQLSLANHRASDTDFPALPMDLRKDNTLMVNGTHLWTINKQGWQAINTRVVYTRVDHLMDNGLKNLDPRMINAKTNALTKNYAIRSETKWQNPGKQLYLGFDFKGESAEGIRAREFLLGPNAGKTIMDNAWQNGEIRKYSIFGEYKRLLKSITLVASSRIEINQAIPNQVDERFASIYPEVNQQEINPSVSLGGTIKLHENHKMGVWVARSQRSASLAERFINFFPIGLDPFELVGNPKLDQEILHQMDLNYKFIRRDLRFSLDLFYGRLSNAISSIIDPSLMPRIPNSPGVRRFVNIEQAEYTGGELSLSYLYSNFTQNIDLAYSYGQDLDRDQPLPEIPPLELRYSIKGDFLNHRLTPYVTWRKAWRQNRISSEFGENTTPGFNTLDIQLDYRLGAYRVGLLAQNLFNTNYWEHLSRNVRGKNQLPIYNPGRSLVLTFGVDFTGERKISKNY